MVSEQGTGRGWQGLADEVARGMAEWRVQHPRATLGEIEHQVDVRLAGVRARMIEDVALRSARTEVASLAGEERPVCPQCGAVLAARGKKTRRLTTSHNQVIRLTRSYAVCPACEGGFFPPG
ncbi:MAG TPA: hypothetical protein VNL71_16110 [Chloroflexota bacterium]|nr:hypothetical protein [Chloroflexota bacterium]